MAIGQVTNDSRLVALAERWNGSRWSIYEPIPTPHLGTSALDSVSCTSPSACAAIAENDRAVFFERWDGTRWSKASSMIPVLGITLWGDLSCASANACTTVGSYYPTKESLATVTLAERWDGTRWSVQPTPHFANGRYGASLGGVSCPSTEACIATGESTSGALIAEQWTASPTIPPTGPPEFTG